MPLDGQQTFEWPQTPGLGGSCREKRQKTGSKSWRERWSWASDKVTDCTDKLSNDRANKPVATNYFSLAWISANRSEHKAPCTEGNSSWTKLGPCCLWRAICSLWGHVLSATQPSFLSFVFHFLHLGVQSKHADIMEACEFLLFLTTVLNP